MVIPLHDFFTKIVLHEAYIEAGKRYQHVFNVSADDINISSEEFVSFSIEEIVKLCQRIKQKQFSHEIIDYWIRLILSNLPAISTIIQRIYSIQLQDVLQVDVDSSDMIHSLRFSSQSVYKFLHSCLKRCSIYLLKVPYVLEMVSTRNSLERYQLFDKVIRQSILESCRSIIPIGKLHLLNTAATKVKRPRHFDDQWRLLLLLCPPRPMHQQNRSYRQQQDHRRPYMRQMINFIV